MRKVEEAFVKAFSLNTLVIFFPFKILGVQRRPMFRPKPSKDARTPFWLKASSKSPPPPPMVWKTDRSCVTHDRFRYPDILPKDTLPKVILPKDILPNGHFADGHFVERTFCRTDSLTNGLFAEKTFCRNDKLPKIEKF